VEEKLKGQIAAECVAWASIIPEIANSGNPTEANGLFQAVCALAANPKLGPEGVAFFVLGSVEVDYFRELFTKPLGQCLTVPLLRQVLGSEVASIAGRLKERLREEQFSPMLLDRYIEHLSTLFTCGLGTGACMTDAQLQEVHSLFEATLLSSKMRANGHDDRDWETVIPVAHAVAALNVETKGRFDADFLVQWLEGHPGKPDLTLEVLLEMQRPVPDPVMRACRALVEDCVEEARERQYIMIDISEFQNALGLLRRAFDARHEGAELMVWAQDLLAKTSDPYVQRDIHSLLLQEGRGAAKVPGRSGDAGDSRNDCTVGGVPSYQPLGPADRQVAVKGIRETTALGAEDFWDGAGDQAILALGDARYKSEATTAFVEVLTREDVGHFLLSHILSRFTELARAFPGEVEAAKAGFIDAVEAAIHQGGQEVEEMASYERIDISQLDRTAMLRVYSALLETLTSPPVGASRASGDDHRAGVRSGARGEIFNASSRLLGEGSVSEVPVETQVQVQKLVEARRELLSQRIDYMFKVATEHGDGDFWKETSPEARRLLGMRDDS